MLIYFITHVTIFGNEDETVHVFTLNMVVENYTGEQKGSEKRFFVLYALNVSVERRNKLNNPSCAIVENICP